MENEIVNALEGRYARRHTQAGMRAGRQAGKRCQTGRQTQAGRQAYLTTIQLSSQHLKLRTALV
jgi:hypothetical protein